MLKICPATSNLPTVMTAASWAALCSATFKKETAPYTSGYERDASKSFCSRCRGKIKPPKLKIVSLDEMLKKTTPTNKELPMTTKVSNRGTCDCCEDKNLVLRNNYGKKMCGKCASMYSNVRNYLPIIEMALAELWPDKYGPNAKQLAASNPDAVKVAVDEKTEAMLKRIAALVGYEGDDPDEMVDHIAASEAMLEHIQRTAAKAFCMEIKQGDIPGLFTRFTASSDAVREQTRFIVTVRDMLGMPFSHLGDLTATLAEKLELLGEYSTTMDRTVDSITMALCKQDEAEQQVERREAALWELVNAMDDIVDDRDELYRLLYNDARKEDAGPNEPNDLTPTQQAIANQCDHLKQTLLEKNRKYGNSALKPVRLFSKADPVEQIRVRIDDKLSRLQSAQIDDTEDVELDLAGYLMLLKVANGAA